MNAGLNHLDALNAGAKPKKSELHKQTERWVAQTFYGTLLKQMRNSPFKSDLFEGGRGGQAFSSLFDQQMIDRMASGSGQKLVRAIVRQIEANRSSEKQEQAKKAYRAAKDAMPTSTPETDESNPFKNVRIHVAPNLRA